MKIGNKELLNKIEKQNTKEDCVLKLQTKFIYSKNLPLAYKMALDDKRPFPVNGDAIPQEESSVPLAPEPKPDSDELSLDLTSRLILELRRIFKTMNEEENFRNQLFDIKIR